MNHYPHDVIRAAGTKSMLRHLWYVSERLVASAFFDDRVSINLKSQWLKICKEILQNKPGKVEWERF